MVKIRLTKSNSAGNKSDECCRREEREHKVQDSLGVKCREPLETFFISVYLEQANTQSEKHNQQENGG